MLGRLAPWLAAAILLLILAAMFSLRQLVAPTRPRSIAGLHFEGFIPLPATGGIVSFLDYLTIYNRNLYAANVSSGAVIRVSLDKAALPTATDAFATSSIGEAHGVTFDPLSGMGFVSRSGVNTVDVLNPQRLVTIRRIAVPADADGIFFDPSNKLIYLANGDQHVATLIDPLTLTRVASIMLPGKPEYAAFDPATRLIYQNIEDADRVAVVDLKQKKVVDTWSIPGCHNPTGMALDSADRQVFIVCGNKVLVSLRLPDHHLVATVQIGGGADSVDYDASLHRVYATGSAGILSVISLDAEGLHKLDDINLAFGAHTLVVDPTTHRLYVGYAGLFTPPALAVFQELNAAPAF